MPYLIVNSNNSCCTLYSFMANITIGRHPQNDVVLASGQGKRISRRHASIKLDDDGYVLVDNSLNGTLMDDKMIKHHRLRHGDQFQIADHDITFIDEASVAPTANGQSPRHIVPSQSNSDEKTERVMSCAAINKDMPDIRLKERLQSIGIVVEDEKMVALYRDIYAVSHINVPILILGEPGTGKEKVAQAIHELSKANGEFIAVNCSAVPEALFESELFGSIKGAYSGAQTKSGKLEAANKGTLFLDEIGDMGITCQPKLLRFLETRSISRLGETRVRQLDIRVVAATNQDLKQMIKTKTFRSDLFHRLACIKLNIPPLRERKEDILPLANFFLRQYTRQYNLISLEISDQAAQIIRAYQWPGNVRELGNIMLNVCVRARGKKILPDDLVSASEDLANVDASQLSKYASIKEMEKHHIKNILHQTGNNKTKACTILGISRDTLYKKIQKYNIG